MGHVSNLENLKTILFHFSEKIEEWATNNLGAVVSISVVCILLLLSLFSQVMDIIKQNYETLTLKLVDNLDTFTMYSEEPYEMAFFIELFSVMVADYQKQYYQNL